MLQSCTRAGLDGNSRLGFHSPWIRPLQASWLVPAYVFQSCHSEPPEPSPRSEDGKPRLVTRVTRPPISTVHARACARPVDMEAPVTSVTESQLPTYCHRCARETPDRTGCKCGGKYCGRCLPEHRRHSCPQRTPHEDLGFRSQRYRCPHHGKWLVLRELDGPRGTVRFWACDAEVNCSFMRPCKYQRGSKLERQLSRAAKATQTLRFNDVIPIPTWRTPA